MGNLLNLKITKDIPERFRNEAETECKKFSVQKWKRVAGLRGKFYSFRLNDCYRILMFPKCLSAIVYHHDKYERKIANLKKRGF